MKVYYDKQWFIERDDGTTIGLSWNESSLLWTKMLEARTWDEVEMRFEDHPQWKSILEERESILEDLLDEMMYETDDVIQHRVYDAVERYVDLDDEEE